VPQHLPQHRHRPCADRQALPSSIRLDFLKEGPRAANRKAVGELKEMLIAGDDDRFPPLGKREEVVVARIGRAGSGCRRVGLEDSSVSEERDERDSVLRSYSGSQLPVAERALELGQQALGDDELELANEPPREELRRRPARREQRCDENVRGEDSTHSATTPPSRVLSLDGEDGRFVFRQVAPLP
jgi:hypothetical protein